MMLFAQDYHPIHHLMRFSPEATCPHHCSHWYDIRRRGWRVTHGDIQGFIDDLSLATDDGQLRAKRWQWWACTHEVQRERVSPHPSQTWIWQKQTP